MYNMMKVGESHMGMPIKKQIRTTILPAFTWTLTLISALSDLNYRWVVSYTNINKNIR